MKKLLLLFAVLFISVAAFSQTNSVGVHIYNPSANAQADIKTAVAKAKKEKKHVLIQVGGNWCSWCIAFHNLVDSTATLKKFINANFETVLVNYSKENKNEDVLASLGYPQRFGFPVFLVLDGNGKVLHIQNSSDLETDEIGSNGKKKVGHNVEKIINFLNGWTFKAVDPGTYKIE
ncbi:thioredoxin family protein [Pedobacter changchengzhani]|uniref:Thioredoxin family protein n=1 Tax=Pedobacter changchengzhani TaxID=2529274 RepID=A0A4R5MMS2_9SPHI|nr:thioredoxin family protein [Pedobacter changchengzhani]TDG37107.1 thioredoxin family protein [Pedobacter changchengzhani]